MISEIIALSSGGIDYPSIVAHEFCKTQSGCLSAHVGYCPYLIDFTFIQLHGICRFQLFLVEANLIPW